MVPSASSSSPTVSRQQGTDEAKPPKSAISAVAPARSSPKAGLLHSDRVRHAKARPGDKGSQAGEAARLRTMAIPVIGHGPGEWPGQSVSKRASPGRRGAHPVRSTPSACAALRHKRNRGAPRMSSPADGETPNTPSARTGHPFSANAAAREDFPTPEGPTIRNAPPFHPSAAPSNGSSPRWRSNTARIGPLSKRPRVVGSAPSAGATSTRSPPAMLKRPIPGKDKSTRLSANVRHTGCPGPNSSGAVGTAPKVTVTSAAPAISLRTEPGGIKGLRYSQPETSPRSASPVIRHAFSGRLLKAASGTKDRAPAAPSTGAPALSNQACAFKSPSFDRTPKTTVACIRRRCSITAPARAICRQRVSNGSRRAAR